MSIARAFTTRRVKQSLEHQDHGPHRSNSTSLKSSMGSIRHKISSPVQLIHTTNMLSYSAPDIHPVSASSASSSPRSDDDMSDSALTTGTSPPTSPDIESPKRSLSPEPNHLSCFFTVPASQQAPTPPSPPPPPAPVIPQRAPSKRTPNVLVRKASASGMSDHSPHRSLSSKASFSFSRSSSTSTSTSVSSSHLHRSKLSTTAPSTPIISAPLSPPRPRRPEQQPARSHSLQNLNQHHHHQRKDHSTDPRENPFGPELAQVSELAEEFAATTASTTPDSVTTISTPTKPSHGVNVGSVSASAVVDNAEERLMAARGLVKVCAEEYLSEVRGLWGVFFAGGNTARVVGTAAGWI